MGALLDAARPAADMLPVLLGAVLLTSGLFKAFARSVHAVAANTVLPSVLGNLERAVAGMRILGAVEIALAVALVTAVARPLPAMATGLLGLGFVGYLGYAKATAPESSCGCSGSSGAPIGVRTFVRASAVAVGGGLAATATGPWWSAVAAAPVLAVVVVLACLAGVAALSDGSAHVFQIGILRPLRRARIRVFGHPLAHMIDADTGAAGGERVGADETNGSVDASAFDAAPPVEASLDLLDRSVAWESTKPVVKSGLIEYWDADGWRILRFAGRQDGEPVTILFAMDTYATLENSPKPRIRVAVLPESGDLDDRQAPDRHPIGV